MAAEGELAFVVLEKVATSVVWESSLSLVRLAE